MRILGHAEMMLATGLADWAKIRVVDIETVPFLSTKALPGLHGAIYRQRVDAGAVIVSSPPGARALAGRGGLLPPLFDEQARHIGGSAGQLPDQEHVQTDLLRNALGRGANAVLLGERLLCLGMTCERALFNVELYEKCARAYVVAACAGTVKSIPWWVRLIANRRLLKNERDAAVSYREGRIPEGLSAY